MGLYKGLKPMFKQNKLSLFILFLFLSSCAWQNETIRFYNENYDCQIDGWYFTKTYTKNDVNVKDEIAYDKEGNAITGVAVNIKENKSCYTKYYKEGKKIKSKNVILEDDMVEEEIVEESGIVKRYENGKYVDYLKNYEDGRVEFYYPDGHIKAIDYSIDGNGSLIMYYPNGQVESATIYKNAKEDGKAYWYYPNGMIESIENYKNGKLEGTKIAYYDNGNKRQEWKYKNDRLNGLAKIYNTKGELLLSMNFINGKLTGDVKAYIFDEVQIAINYNENKAMSGYRLNKDHKQVQLNKKALNELDLSHFNRPNIDEKKDHIDFSVLKENEEDFHFILIYKLMSIIKNQMEDEITNINNYQKRSDIEYRYSFNNDEEISNRKFKKLKRILDKNVKKFEAKSGSFIIMDASDSTILSTYTTKEKDRYDAIPLSVRFYEPGSILKAYTMAMALESKKFTIKDKIDAREPFKLKYNIIRDYRGENRELTMDEVLIYSSNIASAKIALAVGGKYQYEFLKKLGLLDKIDDYEIKIQKPLYPDKERWYSSEISRATMGYGYGISISPLHLITAYSALINGGVYHKPSFERFDDKEGVKVISDKNAKQMRKLLRSVVVKGSGRPANIENIEVMGITGTAQKLNENGRYEDKRVVTTFVGNFEYDNKQYAILVILDEPQPLEETYNFNTSGWNAVPTAKEIMNIITAEK